MRMAGRVRRGVSGQGGCFFWPAGAGRVSELESSSMRRGTPRAGWLASYDACRYALLRLFSHPATRTRTEKARVREEARPVAGPRIRGRGCGRAMYAGRGFEGGLFDFHGPRASALRTICLTTGYLRLSLSLQRSAPRRRGSPSSVAIPETETEGGGRNGSAMRRCGGRREWLRRRTEFGRGSRLANE